jgi:predicted outer membrane protein
MWLILSVGLALLGAGCVGLGCNLTLEPGLDGGEAAFTEGQIAGVMNAAHQAAIGSSDLLLERSGDPPVRALAERIAYAHRTAWVREQALFARLDIRPAQSATSEQLRSDAAQEQAVLQQQSSPAVERTYVGQQVLAQTRLLNLLDNALMPSARAEPLRAELAAVRDVVAGNLDAARSAQEAMGMDSGIVLDAAGPVDGGQQPDSPMIPPVMDGAPPPDAGTVESIAGW